LDKPEKNEIKMIFIGIKKISKLKSFALMNEMK